MRDADKRMYYIVSPQSFAYNPARINVGSIGYQNTSKNVIVSSLYEIFKTTEEVDDRFLWHWFKSDDFQKLIVQLQEGGVRLYFYYDKLCMGSIALPSLAEQQWIGAYLDKLDNLITLHQYKLYMGVYRKGTILTYFWEQRKFSDVFTGLQNNTLSRSELNYESGTVKNVHYGDVLIKFGDYIDASKEELPFINDDSKVEKFKGSFLHNGDIVIADTAEDETVGKCTEIQGVDDIKLISGLHTIPCRPKEEYGAKFLGYYMNSSAYHAQLIPLMQGIKVTSISKSALQDTNMIIPKSVDEQTIIGEYFSNLDHLITLHQSEVERLKKAKQFFLDKMFI